MWSALGLERSASLARPVIVALALALPLVLASRHRWRLSVSQAAAAMAIVLLARAALDPLNISYYALPAFGAMLGLEAELWRRGGHPLARSAWLRRLWGVPVLAIAAGELLAATGGGRTTAWLQPLGLGDRGMSVIYTAVVVVVAGVLVGLAAGTRVAATVPAMPAVGRPA